ncbi:glycosyltransferase family 2 protein [Sulfurospirillum sp. 1612]|uniref:glycosyltransferase family 2 protein n=1 Tax=Sulfurospirillum sp. 1612 TaxID=3094835 RepID=UPI002F94FC14
MNLSIVILTFNSQKYLHDVLQSALFADEVLLLDSGSTDETLNIAKTFPNVKIVTQTWLGFGKQKQAGVEASLNDWVFVLDSDEIITEKLKDEIIATCKKPKHKAYTVPRLNYFFGKPIKRCGLYPDATLRLFDKRFAKFSEDDVHEKVITNEKVGKLTHHMLHLAYSNIEEFINKQNRYSSLNKKSNLFKAIASPYWTFFKIYILRLGFLEGKAGYIIAKLYAQYTFWKYIK